MKLLTVLGSPRPRGNTRVLAAELGIGARQAGAQVAEVFLNNLRISPCQACRACRRAGAGGCIVQDDMTPLYEKIRESDGMVLATPVYWWGPSAQLKAFIDRWYAFGARDYRELAGKVVALLIAHQDPEPLLAGADLVTRMIRDICNYAGMSFTGVVHVSADEPGEAAARPEILDKARELGRQLVLTGKE